MAKSAGHGRVAIRQRKTCSGVVENTRRPRSDWVAACALGRRRRESGRDVVRNSPAYRRRAQKRRLMAPVTIH